MDKMASKTLSVLMSIVLAMGLCPMSAVAADGASVSAGGLQAAPLSANASGSTRESTNTQGSRAVLADVSFQSVKWPLALADDGTLYDFSGDEAAVVANGVSDYCSRSRVLLDNGELRDYSDADNPTTKLDHVSQMYEIAALTDDGVLHEFDLDGLDHQVSDVVSYASGNYEGYLAGDSAAVTSNGDWYTWRYRWVDEDKKFEVINMTKRASGMRSVATSNFAIGDDGALYAWGTESQPLGLGELSEPVDSARKVLDNVSSVSEENGHVLALQGNGDLWSWGSNAYGELGAGFTPTMQLNGYTWEENADGRSSSSPVKIMSNVREICSNGSTCAVIKADSSLWMWGYNKHGGIGVGTTESVSEPVEVLGDVYSAKVGEKAGWDLGGYCAAIKTDGSLWMWGRNNSCQLGFDSGGENVLTPMRVAERISQVYLQIGGGKANAPHWTCALTDGGGLLAWGGVGSAWKAARSAVIENPVITDPTPIMSNVKQVSLADHHGGAVKEDGSLWMWGKNYYGELGTGDRLSSLAPKKVLDDVAVVRVGDSWTSNNYGISAAVKTDGTLWMWGHCADGLLGRDDSGDWVSPQKIMDGVVDVDLHGSGAFAVSERNELWAWGDYASPTQCELVTTTTPTKIMDDVVVARWKSDYRRVGAAVRASGDLYTWGDSRSSLLGIGQTPTGYKDVSYYAPVKILENVVDVCFSSNYAFALTSDGKVYVWGGYYAIEKEGILEPALLAEGISCISSAGGYYVGFVTASGEALVWEPKGRTIEAVAESYANATKVVNDVRWMTLGNAVGSYDRGDGLLGGAITASGAVFATWGANDYGQLGRGWASSYQHEPLLIAGTSKPGISGCSITVPTTGLTYDGTAKTPAVTVKDGSKTLVKGTDYTVSYTDNINAGTAMVTVTGIGDYVGKVTRNFTIAKASPTLSFASPSVSKSLASGAFTNLLTKATDGTVTFKSGNTSVATVNSATGLVTPKAVGATTITATAAEGANYKAGSASYNLTVSKDLSVDVLTYSFGNSSSAFGYPDGYKIPLARYKTFFAPVQASRYYENSGEWQGSCWGMSATTSMLNNEKSGLSVKDFNSAASFVKDLAVGDYNSSIGLSTRDFIETMQVAQNVYSIAYAKGVTNKNKLNGLCAALTEGIAKGEPIIISVRGDNGMGGTGGHALVGYKLEKITSTQSRLYVYDCNYKANPDRYITLSTNQSGSYTGWYYHLNNKYNWGSAYSGSSISYTPYSIYEEVWKNRRLQTEANTLFVNSPNYQVYNSEGTLVADVQDGVLVSAAEGVCQYESDSMTDDDQSDESESAQIYLPSDAVYHLAKGSSAADQLEATMVNVDQSAKVSTDADEVVFAVSDEEGINLVDIDAGAGETYAISLESTAEGGEKSDTFEISGIGAGQKLTAGVADGNCIVANADGAAVYVNGEEMAVGSRIDVAKLGATLEYEACYYDGNQHEPAVTVKNGSRSLVRGEDYVVVYSSNIEVGTAKATVYGIGDYGGKVETTFEIRKKTEVSSLKVSIGSATYTGEERRPAVTVKEGTTVLTKGVDYTVSYSGNINAGVGKVTITGKGAYAGSTTKEFTIKPASLSGVALKATSATYDGKAHKPVVKAVKAGSLAVPTTGYAVTYLRAGKATADFKSAGTVTVKVAGKGNFTGSKTATFTIKPASLSGVALKATSATYDGKARKPVVKAVKAGSLAVPTTGYAVAYLRGGKATSDFKSAGTVTVKVTGKGNFTGSKTATFTIGKAGNPMKASAVEKAVKLPKGKKKLAKAAIVSGAVKFAKTPAGAVTYARVAKGSAKCLKVDERTGKVTVAKGTKAGTYKVKVDVKAAGNANYKPKTQRLTLTVKVKKG